MAGCNSGEEGELHCSLHDRKAYSCTFGGSIQIGVNFPQGRNICNKQLVIDQIGLKRYVQCYRGGAMACKPCLPLNTVP